MGRSGVVLAAAVTPLLLGIGASAAAAAPAVPVAAAQNAHLLDPAHLVVDGTLQCQIGSEFVVSVDVTELGAQPAVRSSPAAAGSCRANGPQAWTVTVTGSGGPFVPVVTTFVKITDLATQESTSNVDQRGIDIAEA
jgi:hypothetical protein